VIALFVVPRGWLVHEKPPTIAFTLQMGSPGEKTGGMTPAGAQTVESVAEPPKRPTPTPVARPPESQRIAIPVKPPPKTTVKPVESAPVASVPQRTPVTGPELTRGSAAAATGATGQGTGLTVGGGVGGASAMIDANFCCMEYAQEVLRRISVNWKKDAMESGETIVMLEIKRDGTFSKPVVEKTSGSPLLDLAAISAFTNLRLQPLPDRYTGETLKIHLSFPYKR